MEWLYGEKENCEDDNDYFDKIYLKKEQLGRGHFGTVFKATNRRNQEIVAMKECNVPDDESQKNFWRKNEVENYLKIGKSDFIVSIIAAWFQPGKLYVATEAYGQNLREYVDTYGNQRVDEDFLWTVLGDALRGLQAVHKKGYIHDDVHAANFLMHPELNGSMKLCDFGRLKTGNCLDDLAACALMIIRIGLGRINLGMENEDNKDYWQHKLLIIRCYIGFGWPLRRILAWRLLPSAHITSSILVHIMDDYVSQEMPPNQHRCACRPYANYFCENLHRNLFRGLAYHQRFDMAFAAHSVRRGEPHCADIFRGIIRNMLKDQEE